MIQELFGDAHQDIDHVRMFGNEMESKIRDLTLRENTLRKSSWNASRDFQRLSILLNISAHMRKIADTSVLRTTIVGDYLRASPQNEVVIPQLVLCECLQGDGVQNARRSLVSLAQFSKQVLVLKGDRHLHRLEPRARGLQSRLIDERLTHGLRTNLKYNLNQTGISAALVNQMIVHDKRQTDEVISLYAKVAETMKAQLLKEGKALSVHELKAIRVHRFLLPDTFDLIERRVMKATAYLLKNAGLDLTNISPHDALNAVPFRFALAIEALSLDWVATGGLESRSMKAVANDIRDVSHIAYSTFFDGIVAVDRRLLSIAALIRVLLEMFERRYSLAVRKPLQ